MSSERSIEDLLKLLSSNNVVDFTEIKKALKTTSTMTAFRYLNRIAYRRSYNHNGRYYTLYSTSKFRNRGLWDRDGIFFSVDGSLINTVRRFIYESKAGATHREIQNVLKVRVQNTLAELIRKGEIERQRMMPYFVYFDSNKINSHKQKQCRKQLIESGKRALLDSDMESIVDDNIIIQILLTLIRHPGSNEGQVARRLRGHSPPIRLNQVKAVFFRYELGEKKGSSI